MADMSAHIPALIDWLAAGKTQKSFCQINKIAPHILQRYIAQSPNTQNELLRARALGAMAEADEIQEIADDSSINTNQARNMIDVRKWRASKFLPKVFGDRIDMNITQTVDLSTALIEARKRGTLQPLRNPELAKAPYHEQPHRS